MACSCPFLLNILYYPDFVNILHRYYLFVIDSEGYKIKMRSNRFLFSGCGG